MGCVWLRDGGPGPIMGSMSVKEFRDRVTVVRGVVTELLDDATGYRNTEDGFDGQELLDRLDEAEEALTQAIGACDNEE